MHLGLLFKESRTIGKEDGRFKTEHKALNFFFIYLLSKRYFSVLE